jgi:hypothetical protein
MMLARFTFGSMNENASKKLGVMRGLDPRIHDEVLE